MILHEKTFKKFGYWPNNLKKKSNKKIIRKCDTCQKESLTSPHIISTSKKADSTCRVCSLNALNEDQKTKAKHRFKTSTIITINAKLWLALYQSCIIIQTPGGFPRIRDLSEFKIKYNTYDIFKTLNLKITTKTADFKLALLEFFLKQDAPFKFYIVNTLFNRHKKKKVKYNCQKNICEISSPDYLKLFDYVDINYVKYSSSIRITKGSFFIDGKWIHIG